MPVTRKDFKVLACSLTAPDIAAILVLHPLLTPSLSLHWKEVERYMWNEGPIVREALGARRVGGWC